MSAGEAHLLVVDDEYQILELLELSLHLSGFDVTTARSGLEALELAKAAPTPFDLVVLDVLMSPWDGFETARQLRMLPDCPPIVFLSGLNAPPAHQQQLAQAYLVKPFRPSQLVAIIRQTLAERLR